MKNLEHIPLKYIPASSAQTGIVLAILSDGKPHKTKELLLALGGVSPRSALQYLQNEKNGFWLIHNSGGFKEGTYQLDDRHLTGDLRDDQKARKERQRILANIRKKQSA